MAAHGMARSCYQCHQRKDEYYNDGDLCMECYNAYPFCLECGLNERSKPRPRCEDCHQQDLGRTADLIIQEEKQVASILLKRVDEYTASFRELLKLFVDRWDRRKSQCPEITAAYFINNQLLQIRYNEYKKELVRNGKEPNEMIHFHGTVLYCNLLSSNAECDNMECGICGIAWKGFDKDRVGHNIPRFQRFGCGIYLAPNSSKCHDYTQGSHDVRAMLICKVALGKSYVLTHNQATLVAAPPGYNSVYGKNSPEGTLNYDEVVVYHTDAILPTHIIVYERDGTSKIAK